MKVAVRYGEQATVPRIKVGTGLVGYAALHKEVVLVPRRLEGSALHPTRRGRAIRAGDPVAAEGPLHRRVRSREPGARRLQEDRRGDPDAARQPGGGRDRERPALRNHPQPTSSGSRRRSVSRSGCRRRCCRPSCRSG